MISEDRCCCHLLENGNYMEAWLTLKMIAQLGEQDKDHL